MNQAKLLPLALALLLAACSTSSGVATDHDPSADFSKYRSFTVRKDAAQDSPAARAFEGILASALQAKGLARVDADPGMTLVPRFSVTKQSRLNPYSGSHAQVDEVQVGSVAVELLDAKTGAVLWRGSAKGVLAGADTPEERERRARAVADELFADFPPRAKRK